MTPKEMRKIPKDADLSLIAEDLRVLAVPVGILTGHPDNPRLHPKANLDAIQGSVRRFKQRKPVVCNLVNGALRVEAGHGLLSQMVALGAEYVAVQINEDTPNDELGYMLADNRTGDLSEDDEGKLAGVLKTLIEAGEDVEEIGFDDEVVKQLIGKVNDGDEDEGNDDAPIDKAAELAVKWGTAKGQIWVIESKTVPGKCHRVMCGDSTIAENYTAVCGGENPWMMVTDPPYGVEYDPNWRNEALKDAWTAPRSTGKVSNDDRAGWKAAYELFTGDVAYVWHAGMFADTVLADLESVKLMRRSQIIWGKLHFAVGRGDYHWQHEPCWYVVRKGKSGGRNDDRTQSTLWTIASLGAFGKSQDAADTASGHGTQKPVECMARPIRNHVFPEGRCVYDPFLGSGTTLVAAEREGVICVGMELNPDYLGVILERAKAQGLEPRLVE